MDVRAPQGGEWALVIDALHALTNTMTVRSHYREGHPAIARADALAESTLTRILEVVPQILGGIHGRRVRDLNDRSQTSASDCMCWRAR